MQVEHTSVGVGGALGDVGSVDERREWQCVVPLPLLRFPTRELSSPTKVPADQSVPCRSQPLSWLSPMHAH